MELVAPARLMQIAKRRLMIKPAPSSSSSLYDSAANDSCTRILEQAIQVLERLIRLCNTSSNSGSKNNGSSSGSMMMSSASLKFNHAQCRFLDMQSFHDNLRNLVDEMASLDAASREQCRTAAVEIAKVTKNAESLVFSWLSSEEEDAEDSWLVKAILHAADDGLSAAQQKQEQQWCVSVLEVVLAQFRADKDDSSKHNRKPKKGNIYQHHVPYWMIDRTYEIAEESLLADTDRGLVQAVRLDRRNLLEKLRKMKHKHDGFFFRGLAVFSSRNRKNGIRLQEVTTYLLSKLDVEDDGIESFVEIINQKESWAAEIATTRKTEDSLLGIGCFGIVHKSDFLGFPAALKITAFYSRESFWNEVSVLANIRHPRVAQLIFATISDEELGECRLWTELLGKSLDSILDVIQKTDQILELPVAVEIMLQVAEGMAYLHKRGILHRHLKASNVLLVPKPKRRKKYTANKHELDEFVQVKITDYGLPKTKLAGSASLMAPREDDEPSVDDFQQQLPFWQAPEVFQQANSEATFSKKSDVYSFGMLCYHVLSSSKPFSNTDYLTENLLFRLVSIDKVRPEIPSHCPAYLAVLIHKCWSHDPEERPSFAEIYLALKSLKGLITRKQSSLWNKRQQEHILPFTPSDFSHLFNQLGFKFLVDTIVLHTTKQQGEAERLFLMMLEKNKGPEFWPFPVENFVLWLANAAEQLEHEEGFGAAAEIAGDLMANWIGPTHEFEQAVFWYYKASSCKNKSSGGSARWKLGMCLESGFGIAKDEKRAFGLYKQAAREGCASAHVEVGRCYQSGKGAEVCNQDKAVAHFAKALEMLDKNRGSGSSLDCVEFLMKMLATASQEEDCLWAADRIHEIATKSRLGRIIVAGRDCCNVRELVGLLGDWRVKEIGRKKAKMILERLAVEDDILQQALLA